MNNTFLPDVHPILAQDRFGVWYKEGSKQFDYSDGADAEKYLYDVFSKADDLSSDSEELEGMGRNWASEYHLTRKRAQLLRAFAFNRSARVLEVGCGCGAITRFLGETFNDVVAVEGSRVRARLARMRTRGQENVTIISSPFQEVQFERKFDIIFCIGVFEYSAYFVSASDPYSAVLDHFAKLLNPGGYIVMAIENQLGLKYFTTSTEDHTNRMFEGIEGYPHFGATIRTFGYQELRTRLSEHFPHQAVYFPYPDYKIPDVVVSEEFLGRPNAVQLVGNCHSSDYSMARAPLFDEKLAGQVLARNGLLSHLANSFLVFAGKGSLDEIRTSPEGIYFSSGRDRTVSTITTLVREANGELHVYKRLRYPQEKEKTSAGPAHVRWRSAESRWRNTPSIETRVLRELMEGRSFEQALQEANIWIAALREAADGQGVLPCWLLDPTWDNSFVVGDRVEFEDQEWEAPSGLQVGVAVCHALYCFYAKLPAVLRRRVNSRQVSGRAWVIKTAGQLGIMVSGVEIQALIDFEAGLHQRVSARKRRWIKLLVIRLFFFSTKLWEKLEPWGRRMRSITLLRDRVCSRILRLHPLRRSHVLFAE